MSDKELTKAGLQQFVDETTAKLKAIPDLDGKVGEVEVTLKELGERVKAMGSRFVSAGEAGKHTLPISKAEFARGSFKALYDTPSPIKRDVFGDLEPAEGPFQAWKRAGDELQLVTAALNSRRRGMSPVKAQETEFYRAKYLPAFETVKSILKDAIDTSGTAPGAGDWIPTGFSNEIERLVQINLRLLSFVRTFDMPTNPFNFPRQAGRVTFYRRASEETAAFPAARTTGLVPDAAGTTDLHQNVPFNAEEIHGLVTVTEIAEEDAVAALIPFYRAELPNDLARHLEDAGLNADTAVAHQDADVTAAASHLKAWDGLRKAGLANAATRVDAGGNALNSNAQWGSQVRDAIAHMGAYGGNLDELVQVVGTRVFNKAFIIPDYRTMFAVGPQATALGADANRAFRPDGHNLVVSEFARENLNASGVYDGAVTNRAASIVFNRMAWMLARRRQITVDVFTDSFFKLYGQAGIMLTWRGDFQPIKDPTLASQTHTVVTFNSGT